MSTQDSAKWNQQLYGREHHGLMNADDAASVLGTTRRTVCRWEAAGKMPPRVPHKGRMLYRRADIEEIARRIRGGSVSVGGSGQ